MSLKLQKSSSKSPKSSSTPPKSLPRRGIRRSKAILMENMENMSIQTSIKKEQIIKYYVCGMNSYDNLREQDEISITNYMYDKLGKYNIRPNSSNYEFKYVCFPFWGDSYYPHTLWGDQLRGVIGACGPFFPKFKKPIKSQRSKKIANFFTRRRNPQLAPTEKCKNILNIEEESESKAFKKLLQDVIDKLNHGYKVELYGFSYGGAVLNILANKIHLIMNDMITCNEKEMLQKFQTNLIIFTFGSIFVYDIFKTRNVKLYNIMMFGDVALICNGLNPREIIGQDIVLDSNMSFIELLPSPVNDQIIAYYYYDYKNEEPMSRVYWIFPEFSDHKKETKYKNLVENNSWYNRLTRSFHQLFRWELHGLYEPIINKLMIMENPDISSITGKNVFIPK
jgi:hypothetical protein